jgi:hypothetical protein
MFAVENGHDSVAELLVERSASLDASNKACCGCEPCLTVHSTAIRL